jgi:hypothetical protein
MQRQVRQRFGPAKRRGQPALDRATGRSEKGSGVLRRRARLPDHHEKAVFDGGRLTAAGSLSHCPVPLEIESVIH